MELLSRKLMRRGGPREEFDWAVLYRRIKSPHGQISAGGDFLQELSLHDVRLDPDSRHGEAQRTNLEYLLMLDVDQLVWSFRKQAGLQYPGKPYGGWESPDIELRGHFVGHYMSASAKMWASTHNDTLYQKMSAVVEALNACQKKMGTGYLSAFPTELFDRFEALRSVWAPYYTIHKIMAGLLDQYLYAGNNEALQMVVWMAEYFGNRVENVIKKYTIERHWTSLNEETGGMNDVLYNLYSITGDQKHLKLAHLFDKPCFLGLLAVQSDSLSGFHANTHIPIVIGAQRRYEITGDPLYKDIGTYFMDIINSSHSYATGGTSFGEFWSDPKHLAETLKTENEESCTTYNMLKVSRNLFRWTREMSYVDYYERAMTNGVLSIQRGTDPGIMIYMLPLGVGVSKAKSYHGWGTQFSSFWCCYGTGIESFSKLGDSIYFEKGGSTPSLYIVQYVSNSLNWKSGGIRLGQKVEPLASSEPYLRVTLTFSPVKAAAQSSELNLRIPFWTRSDAKAALNDESLNVPLPGNFLSITRKWSPGDKLILQLPVGLRMEAIEDERPEYASVQAILFGPYLLAGLSKTDWQLSPAAPSLRRTGSLPPSPAVAPPLWSSPTPTAPSPWRSYPARDPMPRPRHFPPRPGEPLAGAGAAGDARTPRPPRHGSGGAAGTGGVLTVAAAGAAADSTFRVVAGLDGKNGTVSFESLGRPGCYILGAAAFSPGESVRLGAAAASPAAASFSLNAPMRGYNPISFVAKGATRDFLLEPLMSLKDESYTAYFSIGG
ncbi:unnamed protein product [Spirodela intermedia]|uniref:Uncharacterized protein n=1 Tax=Spirodela intermedia TaxID=51605 RepID=A0A7I8JRE4_SPIIN|nr:unnamed protein product [Spirodela intermedia]CAA6672335.1 unnamed protein product [Spirodela intermedia]